MTSPTIYRPLIVANTFLSIVVLSIVGLCASTTLAFTFLGSGPTKWEPGFNTASSHGFSAPAGPMSPGGVSWSAMPTGLLFSAALGGSEETTGGGPHPVGDASTDIESLLTSAVDGKEYGIINDALNVWASVANITNLGQVADGATLLPSGKVGDLDASNGHVGDIRVGSFSFGGPNGDLAQTFQPGTEAIFGMGGTIAGDMHFNRDVNWIDDPNDPSAGNDFDFFTIALHEIGHALGLGHSNVVGSVMTEFYEESRRTLQPDDIAGITALYGAVPEPSTMALAVFGLLGLACRRRRSPSS